MLSIGKYKQITQPVHRTSLLVSLGRRKKFQRALGCQPTATWQPVISKNGAAYQQTILTLSLMQTSKINSKVMCIFPPPPSPSKKKALVHKENYSTVLCSAVPSCVHTAQVPHLQLMHLRILVHMESLSFTLTHTRMLMHTTPHPHSCSPTHTAWNCSEDFRISSC